jgi:hypothetical protein
MPILPLALMLLADVLPPRPMLVQVFRDPITDEVRAFATLREAGNRLVISCRAEDDAAPRVTFHSRRWLARGRILSGERPVTYRFDRQPPRRSFWDIDARHATLTNRRRVGNFLNGLYSADRLVIRTRDMEDRRIDAIFRLKETRPAVEQALAACGQASRAAD